MPELLPAPKRTKILDDLANIEPMPNALVLNGITKGTIGLRVLARMLGHEAEIERLHAELERRWEYGFRVIDRPGASVYTDGIGAITWLGTEADAREHAAAWVREWRRGIPWSRAEIVRRYAAGEVDVVGDQERETSDA